MAWTEKWWIAGGAGAVDGSSEANAWDTPTLISSVAPGNRVNMKASVDANAATSRSFGVVGTTTAPVWFRGYKTTIGDLDNQPSSTRVAGTDIPSLTFTTGGMTIGATGAHQIWSNIDIVGARVAGPQLSVAGGTIRLRRVRVENTGANALSTATALTANGNYTFTASWFKANVSATRAFDTGSRTVVLPGCVFTGGGVGLDLTATGAVVIAQFCLFDGCGSHGIRVNGAATLVDVTNCDFIGCGGDGFNVTTLPTAGSIRNCLFILNGGYGINNATGTATNLIQRANNDFGTGAQANTSGTENGFGDSPTFNDVSESSSPFVSGTNRGLVSTANARGAGLPGLFENVSYIGYLDIGAVQEQAGTGGGSDVPVGARSNSLTRY